MTELQLLQMELRLIQEALEKEQRYSDRVALLEAKHTINDLILYEMGNLTIFDHV